MAALFTPEGDKLRKAQRENAQKGAGAPGKAFAIPVPQGIPEGSKAQDSLGNPNGPLAYDPLRKQAATPTEEEKAQVPTFEVPGSPEESRATIRLGSGWDRLLVTQKKLCEKAKNLFTMLDAPVRYRVQKKSSMIQLKSRGSILNLDPEDVIAAGTPPEKKKESA